MGLFDDITHAIGSVFESAGNIIAGPFQLIGEVASGKNLGEALKDFVTREVGSGINVVSLGLENFLSNTSGQDLLRGSVLNTLTFGVSSDVAGATQSLADLSKGTSINNLPAAERNELIRTLAIAGAAAGGALLAPELLPATFSSGYETAGAIAAGESSIAKGSLVGGVLALGSVAAGNSEAASYIDAAGEINSVVNPPKQPPASAAPPKRPAPRAPTTTPTPQAPVQVKTEPNLLVPGGLALAVKVLLWAK